MFYVPSLCQTEKWSLMMGGHLVQVNYGKNPMHGGT